MTATPGRSRMDQHTTSRTGAPTTARHDPNYTLTRGFVGENPRKDEIRGTAPLHYTPWPVTVALAGHVAPSLQSPFQPGVSFPLTISVVSAPLRVPTLDEYRIDVDYVHVRVWETVPGGRSLRGPHRRVQGLWPKVCRATPTMRASTTSGTMPRRPRLRRRLAGRVRHRGRRIRTALQPRRRRGPGSLRSSRATVRSRRIPAVFTSSSHTTSGATRPDCCSWPASWGCLPR